MKYLIIIVASILILLPAQKVRGQQDCGLVLLDARDLYDAGIVEEVPNLLRECIAGGFSIEDLQEAYKLVINSYLYDGFPEKADSVMQMFLQVFPDYEPTSADPAEFQQLMDTYQTDPYLSIGILAGSNFSFPQMLESYGTSQPIVNRGGYRLATPGFQVSGLLNIRLFHNGELGIELQYRKNQITYQADPYPFTGYEYNEQQDLFSIPVSLSYIFSPNRVVKPYLRLGLSMDFLINATADGTRYYTETGDAIFKDVSIPQTKMTDQRARYNGTAFAGAGLRFKLSKSFIFLDARYCYSLAAANLGDSRYDNPDLNWLIYYVDNNFKVNYATVSIGYIRNFYNPKKKP